MDSEKSTKDGPEKPAGGPGPANQQDDSVEAASEEAVEFLEEGDEPGHAGRGDGG